MVQFKTRLFKEGDLAQVVHINKTCLPENYSNSFFLEIFRHFPQTFLVATVDRKVGGYIMCRIEMGFSDVKRLRIVRKGHIISLAVLPEYRKIGIAHDLVAKILRNLAKQGISECYLEVRVRNKTAINLYHDFGFTTSRTIPGYYRDNEDAYLMSRVVLKDA